MQQNIEREFQKKSCEKQKQDSEIIDRENVIVTISANKFKVTIFFYGFLLLCHLIAIPSMIYDFIQEPTIETCFYFFCLYFAAVGFPVVLVETFPYSEKLTLTNLVLKQELGYFLTKKKKIRTINLDKILQIRVITRIKELVLYITLKNNEKLITFSYRENKMDPFIHELWMICPKEVRKRLLLRAAEFHEDSMFKRLPPK